jgi:hypothetical protein
METFPKKGLESALHRANAPAKIVMLQRSSISLKPDFL